MELLIIFKVISPFLEAAFLGDQNDQGCEGLSPRVRPRSWSEEKLEMPGESIYYGEPKTLSWWPRKQSFSFSKVGDDLILILSTDSVSNCKDLAAGGTLGISKASAT